MDPIGQSKKLLALNCKELFLGMYTWRNLGYSIPHKSRSIVNSESFIFMEKIPFPGDKSCLKFVVNAKHSITLHPIFMNVDFVFTFSQTVLATILFRVIASLSMHVTYLHRSKEFANLKVKML